MVGARAGAWAPCPRSAGSWCSTSTTRRYQEEQAPTWHARDVAIERARRAGVPCLLVSPCPTLEALAWGDAGDAAPRRRAARAGRASTVVDRRQLDPALGPLFSPALVDLVRGDGRVLCVLNRTGRARLLACAVVRELARCERCDAAVGQPERRRAALPAVRHRATDVCLACGVDDA